MPRKPRIDEIGFYHIINRGVEKRDIFLNYRDNEKFLEIVEESSEVYNFTIHSFCLMKNHYHLLLQTHEENLSLIMRQINSRYSIYFNNKYKRVGPLWQGRFKSFFVYDENYLISLIKYIEYNPIKANLTSKIGQYEWSMSSKKSALECLDFELINQIDFAKEPTQKELQEVDAIFTAKFELKDTKPVKTTKEDLNKYFENFSKEVAIAEAIKDGYLQTLIAKHLELSNVAISKTHKNYRQKVKLFDKLKDKGIFWSYSKDITYAQAGNSLFIEHILKYADFDDIVLSFKLFGKRVIKKIWEQKVASDQQFIKTNLMLARVFFGMDVESSYFKDMKNARFEKLKLLAS